MYCATFEINDLVKATKIMAEMGAEGVNFGINKRGQSTASGMTREQFDKLRDEADRFWAW